MVVLKNINHQKIIAHVLLACVLAIQVIKVLHTHLDAIATKNDVGIEFDKIVHQHHGECNICEFHLLGNGKISVPTFLFLIPLIAYAFGRINVRVPYFQPRTTLCLRGPPSSGQTISLS